MMKRLTLATAVIAMSVSGPLSAGVRVQLNYKEAPLSLVMDNYAEWLKRNTAMGPQLAHITITLATDSIPLGHALEVIGIALTNAGVEIVERGCCTLVFRSQGSDFVPTATNAISAHAPGADPVPEKNSYSNWLTAHPGSTFAERRRARMALIEGTKAIEKMKASDGRAGSAAFEWRGLSCDDMARHVHAGTQAPITNSAQSYEQRMHRAFDGDPLDQDLQAPGIGFDRRHPPPPNQLPPGPDAQLQSGGFQPAPSNPVPARPAR